MQNLSVLWKLASKKEDYWSVWDWFCYVLHPKYVVSSKISSYHVVMVGNKGQWQYSVFIWRSWEPTWLVTFMEVSHTLYWEFSFSKPCLLGVALSNHAEQFFSKSIFNFCFETSLQLVNFHMALHTPILWLKPPPSPDFPYTPTPFPD